MAALKMQMRGWGGGVPGAYHFIFRAVFLIPVCRFQSKCLPLYR